MEHVKIYRCETMSKHLNDDDDCLYLGFRKIIKIFPNKQRYVQSNEKDKAKQTK